MQWTGLEQGLSDDQIDDVRSMAHLQSFYSSSTLDNAVLARLCRLPAALTSLQSIRDKVGLSLTAESGAMLANLPSITSLDVHVSGTSVEYLTRFTQLHTLSFHIEPRSGTDRALLLTGLRGCTQLTDLKLVQTTNYKENQDDALRMLFSGLTRLGRLECDRVCFMDLGCIVTPHLQWTLHHLVLTGCNLPTLEGRVTHEMIKLLDLTALRSLVWSGNKRVPLDHVRMFELPCPSMSQLEHVAYSSWPQRATFSLHAPQGKFDPPVEQWSH